MDTTHRREAVIDTSNDDFRNDLLTELFADYGYTTRVADGCLVATSPAGVDMAVGYDDCCELMQELANGDVINADNANRAVYRDNQLLEAA